MDTISAGLFLVSAFALLGSPGPAIAALVAVGRSEGWTRGLSYFAGLQVGLALAAGATAAGLFSLIAAIPEVTTALKLIAAAYLLYLAYKIASAPVGTGSEPVSTASSPFAGALLGLSNPKAYVAFLSLFASFELVAASPHLDSLVKWGFVVMVMALVDLVWLLIGVGLGTLKMNAQGERTLNYAFAALIVAAALFSFL